MGRGAPAPDLWAHEEELYAAGCARVAGVDEAGRGPLAGPVVAAAVILPPGFRDARINDSKLLSAKMREELAPLIKKAAVACAVAAVSAREIERINIRQASLLAMAKAVRRLAPPPDFLLIDAMRIEAVDLPQRPIVGGDRLSASIAAASILAKVARDRIMTGYHRLFPAYNFAGHKGYGTREHREAIRLHGPCREHRRTFRGVREHCPEDDPFVKREE